MHISFAAAVSATVLMFAVSANPANALTPRASAAPTPVASAPTGPAIPGVCVLAKDRMIFESAVGKATISRLEQLKAQVSAELGGEGSALDNDAKALEAQRASLSQEQLQQRGGALNQRANALQRKAEQRQRELTATQQKAFSRISASVDPIVRQVFVQRSCSLLLDGAALLYPAPAMDITETVIHGMDAQIQPFPFEREHLDQGAAAPAS